MVVLGSFENSDSVHVRMLQTLYKNVTGRPTDVPRYGNHWDDIGFQGQWALTLIEYITRQPWIGRRQIGRDFIDTSLIFSLSVISLPLLNPLQASGILYKNRNTPKMFLGTH